MFALGSASANRNGKKFTSIGDVLQSGSPIAKNLFGASGAGSSQKPDALKDKLKDSGLVQPTGKVGGLE